MTELIISKTSMTIKKSTYTLNPERYTFTSGNFSLGSFTAEMAGDKLVRLSISPDKIENPKSSSEVNKIKGAIETVLAGGKNPLPLDLSWATPFQQKIYSILPKIPAGEMWRYGDIAARVGSACASRAFGSSCFKNRIAILIPCHRVTRADGKPCGYSWSDDKAQNKKRGYQFKQAIIKFERGKVDNH